MPRQDGLSEQMNLSYVVVQDCPEIAVALHGVFDSKNSADLFACNLLENDETQCLLACVVDQTHRWLPIVKVDTTNKRLIDEFAEETEEVCNEENKTAGREGSVCTLPGMTKQIDINEKGKPVLKQDNKKGKTKKEERIQYENQRAQLEDMLKLRHGRMSYAELRDTSATLRAFSRKLSGLIEKAEGAIEKVQGTVDQLETTHPEYAVLYKENYAKALTESGMKTDNVELFNYLD